MVLRLLCILIVGLCFFGQSIAQKQESAKDTIHYNSNEKFLKKTKLTKVQKGPIFNPTLNTQIKTKRNTEKIPKANLIEKGKIVRNIYITTLDPFSHSLQDTSVHPKGFLIKTVNLLHIQTRRKVIRDLLLFKENEPFDSLLVKESERLIRNQIYVQDLLISTYPSSSKSDSLDVYIKVSDVWSILPSLNMSGTNQEVGLRDDNFLGLGNRFHVDIRNNNTFNNNVFQIGYLIPNFQNTHITGNFQYYFSGNNDLINNMEFASPVYSPVSSNLQYLTLDKRHLVKSLDLSRTFYSPVTKWAGGLFIGQLITNQNYVQDDSVRYLSAKTNIQDYWIARSWQLKKGNSLNARSTNIIVSGRMLRTRYPNRSSKAESLNVFNNENIYFAGIGFTSREYIQDRYIFNYGKVEDIPIGWAFGNTIGLSVKSTNKFYLGFKAAWGNYYRFGYLSSNIEYGTLIGTQGLQQQVITGRINYYTSLFRIGYWKLRQFIRPTFTVGLNRLATDNLSLNNVINGFEELKYPATRMMALTLQTQCYAPWELYGFRFGPYIFSSFGMLGNNTSGIADTRLYSVLGLGLLIKNNYLMINTFQISITFYPYLPGSGNNILNINAYKTSDYGFDDFEISKPKVVDYR